MAGGVLTSAARFYSKEDAVRDNETLLRINNLSKSYDGKTLALDDISLALGKGEFVSVIGSSGAGKSTLLRCINRLIKPSSGSIVFDGVEMTELRGKRLRTQRRRMSMVFQNYNLVLRSSVIQNVLQGRLGYKNAVAGALGVFSKEDKEKALSMLERVGMADFAYVRADQLSGGQKQRVGIARALVQEPALILADEPIASLDPKTSRTVMDLLRTATDDLGIACLVSLHQVEFAREYSDFIFGIAKGQECCKGTPCDFTNDVLAGVYEDEDLLDA